MRLKICDSHLTCKVANKCLNVREWVEVVEWNKKWSSPFPCCPVSRQCPWKKTLIEKKSFISNRTPSEIFHWEFFEIYLNFYRTSVLGTAVSGFLIILNMITFWRQNKFLRLLSIFSIVSQWFKKPRVFLKHHTV